MKPSYKFFLELKKVVMYISLTLLIWEIEILNLIFRDLHPLFSGRLYGMIDYFDLFFEWVVIKECIEMTPAFKTWALILATKKMFWVLRKLDVALSHHVMLVYIYIYIWIWASIYIYIYEERMYKTLIQEIHFRRVLGYSKW